MRVKEYYTILTTTGLKVMFKKPKNKTFNTTYEIEADSGCILTYKGIPFGISATTDSLAH